MIKQRKIKITKDSLITILGDDYSSFKQKIIPNCNCFKCNSGYRSTIIDYDIFLNDLNDIILEGFCAKCGGPINRYLETGEVDKYAKRIKTLQKNKKE